MQTDLNIHVEPYKRFLYCYQEKIPILVLSPERLNFLIYNTEFEEKLNFKQKRIKDYIVFGCTVALRYSDLNALTHANIVQQLNSTYLQTRSIKSQTYTSVKLPDYAVAIIKKYKLPKNKLLPDVTKATLNANFKNIAELAGWVEENPKMRSKKGELFPIYKNKQKKTNYRFCDLVSSHTMRRTAITTMLLLGMQEMMVRKISGHAPGSKEFFRYVELVQNYMDKQTDDYHSKLEQLSKNNI